MIVLDTRALLHDDHLTVAQHAEEPRLQARRQINDILQKERAAFREKQLRGAPDAFERSPLDGNVARRGEQLHLEILRRAFRAIGDDKRSLALRT